MSHRAAPLFPKRGAKLFQKGYYFPGKTGAHLRGTARELRGNCADKFSEEDR